MNKTFKRIIAVLMILMLNITSYAAVGGNDGSAFVTKAEFDAIVNTFNEQMDNYESSMITKIDGSIANYISARSNYRLVTLLDYATQVKNMGSQYITFYNYPTSAFATSTKTNYGQAGAYYYYWKGAPSSADMFSVLGRQNSNYFASSEISYVNFGEKNSLYLFRNNDIIADTGSGYDDNAIFLEDVRSYNNFIKIAVSNYFSTLLNATQMTEAQLKNGTTTAHSISIGNRNGFNGTYNNVESCKIVGENINPSGTISETWDNNGNQSFAGAGYPSANKITSQVLYGVNNANRNYYDGEQQILNNVNGSQAGGKFFCYKNGSGSVAGAEVRSGCSWKYQYYWHKIFTTDVTKLSNYGASQTIGKAVRLYNGIPLTRVNTEGTVSFYCLVTNTVGNDTYLTISDEPFDNDNRYSTKPYTVGDKTYDHILFNEKITPNISTEVKFNVNYIADKNQGTILYYRLSQETFSDRTVKMSMALDSAITLQVDE